MIDIILIEMLILLLSVIGIITFFMLYSLISDILDLNNSIKNKGYDISFDNDKQDFTINRGNESININIKQLSTLKIQDLDNMFKLNGKKDNMKKDKE